MGQLDPRVRNMAVERLMSQAKPTTVLVTGTRELLPTNSYELVEREEKYRLLGYPPEYPA